MKKEVKCSHCKNSYVKDCICDECGAKLGDFNPIVLSFGYPHDRDETTLDFCSNACLRKWVEKNLEQG